MTNTNNINIITRKIKYDETKEWKNNKRQEWKQNKLEQIKQDYTKPKYSINTKRIKMYSNNFKICKDILI